MTVFEHWRNTGIGVKFWRRDVLSNCLNRKAAAVEQAYIVACVTIAGAYWPSGVAIHQNR